MVPQLLNLDADSFPIKFATDVVCVFFTSAEYQHTTLVMGPGVYRFGDNTKFAASLSLMVMLD